jgi:hypothetical protein
MYSGQVSRYLCPAVFPGVNAIQCNAPQELARRRSIEVFEDGAARPHTLSVFPEDRREGLLADASITTQVDRTRRCTTRPPPTRVFWTTLQ